MLTSTWHNLVDDAWFVFTNSTELTMGGGVELTPAAKLPATVTFHLKEARANQHTHIMWGHTVSFALAQRIEIKWRKHCKPSYRCFAYL